MSFFDVSSFTSPFFTSRLRCHFPAASPDTPYAAHAVAVLSTRPKRKCEILELSQESHHVTMHRQQKHGHPKKFDGFQASMCFFWGKIFCGFKGSKKSERGNPRAPLGTKGTEEQTTFLSCFSISSLYIFICSSLRWLAGNGEWQKHKEIMVTFYGHSRLLEGQRNVMCLF